MFTIPQYVHNSPVCSQFPSLRARCALRAHHSLHVGNSQIFYTDLHSHLQVLLNCLSLSKSACRQVIYRLQALLKVKSTRKKECSDEKPLQALLALLKSAFMR